MSVVQRPGSGVAVGFGRRVGLPGLGIVAATLVAAAALLPVAQSSSTTSTGRQIQTLERERADLLASMYATQSDIASLGSVERIDREARERLGMVPADRWMYVSVANAPPAARMPARYLNQESAPRPSSRPLPWWKAALRLTAD